MKLLDVNVLLYAVNRDAVQHKRVRPWLEKALSGAEPVGFAWIVLLGFLRLATNPKIFATPFSTAEALTYVDDWLAHEQARLVTETDEHWNTLRALLSESGAAGNLTVDAHLAALAISHGATLVSCDADFGRFRSLRWENPAAE